MKYIKTFANHLNENMISEKISDVDMEATKELIKNNAFLKLRKPLTDMGFKVDFVTEPMPMYTAKKSGQALVILNKKYVSEPDFVHGEIAMGILENMNEGLAADIIEENKKKAEKVMKVATADQKKVLDDFQAGTEYLFFMYLGKKEITVAQIDHALEVMANTVEGDASQLEDEHLAYAKKKGWWNEEANESRVSQEDIELALDSFPKNDYIINRPANGTYRIVCKNNNEKNILAKLKAANLPVLTTGLVGSKYCIYLLTESAVNKPTVKEVVEKLLAEADTMQPKYSRGANKKNLTTWAEEFLMSNKHITLDEIRLSDFFESYDH